MQRDEWQNGKHRSYQRSGKLHNIINKARHLKMKKSHQTQWTNIIFSNNFK